MSVDASEPQAVERTHEAHVAVLNRGDGEAWATAFANDGVQMPSNAPANAGKDNIEAWSGAFLCQRLCSLDRPAAHPRRTRGHLTLAHRPGGTFPQRGGRNWSARACRRFRFP
jgi:hypothetical protein